MEIHSSWLTPINRGKQWPTQTEAERREERRAEEQGEARKEGDVD